MILANNTKRTLGAILGVIQLTFLAINKAEAGVVRIINNSTNNIRVNIIPGLSSECLPYCWKCLKGSKSKNGDQIKEIAIPMDALKGNELFAVVGTEGGFLFNGICSNLSVLKNYEISFDETPFNVSCRSKEITIHEDKNKPLK